jgi:UDP-4-amino-4,6-dideoxy-N-acetyl-beta-L-altrosamine N-acetyltransferase
MLSSPRIRIRAIEEADLSLIASWRSDPSVYEYFYEYLPISLREQKNWYEKQLNNSNEFNFIVADKDNKPIGTVSIYNIDRRNRKADWGRLIIADSHRGKGFGKESLLLIMQYAFDHLNLHRLYCEVLEDNKKAKNLYELVGFKSEGLLKEGVFKHGGFKNIIPMSLLEPDYRFEKEHGRLKDIRSKIFTNS